MMFNIYQSIHLLSHELGRIHATAVPPGCQLPCPAVQAREGGTHPRTEPGDYLLFWYCAPIFLLARTRTSYPVGSWDARQQSQLISPHGVGAGMAEFGTNERWKRAGRMRAIGD